MSEPIPENEYRYWMRKEGKSEEWIEEQIRIARQKDLDNPTPLFGFPAAPIEE